MKQGYHCICLHFLRRRAPLELSSRFLLGLVALSRVVVLVVVMLRVPGTRGNTALYASASLAVVVGVVVLASVGRDACRTAGGVGVLGAVISDYGRTTYF